ncbi:MAG: ATP-binding protein [bacterium]|nr:ATP-binding protein [bacterium]
MSIRLRPRSVRGKAVFGSGIAITIFGLGIGLAAYVVVTQAAITSATSALETQVGEVSDQMSEQAATDPAAVDLDALTAGVPTFIQVTSVEGAVIAASPSLADADLICPQPASGESSSDRTILSLAGESTGVIRFASPVDTSSGSVIVCAATSDESVQKAQSAVLLALLIAIPLLVLGVCVVVWLAVGRALRAVDELTTQADAMQSIADGQLRVRATRDEVEHLGNTLNELLARLHQQTKATRQFVADAGHELRNPLSTLRVTLEFGEDADADGLRSSVRDALGDLGRLEVLVQDLLVLARTDAMEGALELEDLDLEAIAGGVVSDARRSRPDLSFALDSGRCLVRGNGLAVRSLMMNLVDNAARHAQSAVGVRIGVEGSFVVVRVDDDGLGLSPQDCQRVFDRFVRLDDARDRDEGGSGLGLAIVASIAEAHGGHAFAEPGPGGHFSVDFPLG